MEYTIRIETVYSQYGKTSIQQNFDHFLINNSLLINRKASSIRRCLFVLRERGNTMADRECKTIYCPKCGRKAMNVDEKSKMDFYSKCKKCNKIVYYHAETKTVEMKDSTTKRTDIYCQVVNDQPEIVPSIKETTPTNHEGN